MFLSDIGKNPESVFKRINKHLETNYGFAITETVDRDQLQSVIMVIEQEVHDLKVQGKDSKTSPEISKRLLILEGLRTLKESFKSPDFDQLINSMAECVVDYLRRTSYDDNPQNFENAIAEAMKQYRASEYLFPDDHVESCIRDCALQQLSIATPVDALPATDSVSLSNISAADMPEEPASFDTEIQLTNNHKEEQMFEQKTLVKNLRRLLETEVSQAEVMMAAKGFAQELQEMVEKIGRLQNEDLPPVTDQMRETYGTDSASAFQTQIYSALQGVMDSLYTAKSQVDDAVESMATTGQVGAQVDMDKDIPVDSVDVPDNTVDDLDNIDADDLGDEFGGAEEEEPLGRAMKAESMNLERRILEMKKLVEKARQLKEAKQK